MMREKNKRMERLIPLRDSQTNSLDVNSKGDCVNNSTTALPPTTLSPLTTVDKLRQLTDSKLRTFWDKNQDDLKYRFGRMCSMWIDGLKYDKKSKSILVERYTKLNKNGTCKLRQFGRLLFGYNGLGFRMGIKIIGLRSKAAIGLPTSKTTDDHILGVTLVGWIVHNKILSLYNDGKSADYIIDYMINEWLFDHLHYWCVAKITREEHKKENLPRDEHKLEQKLSLEHYDEADIEL